ncbi:MAG: TIR domain-containing protein [Acidobacteria bacterium]|nr:TIR domain-containing protein [Acidobacteriota bacterium]
MAHEIFISYAHADNAPLAEGLEGWVDLFHERLRIRLRQLLGRDVPIWRDPKLGGNDDFSSEIFSRLSEAAILIPILTPSYLTSEWCPRELSEFCRYAEKNGGIRLRNKSRIFKVIKTYLPRQRHPQEVKDSLGYEFYAYDPTRDRAMEFSPDVKPDRDIRYWAKLEDLAWDIKIFIENLSAISPSSSASASQTVYLAETTSDLNGKRDELRRELQQRGHLVLPDKDLPLQVPALNETINDCLDRSLLAVHLIGEHYGIVPEMEAERSIVRLQYDLSGARPDASKLIRLLWMPEVLQPADPRQQAFIEELQNGMHRPKNTELLQISLEDLKTRIHDKLAVKPKPLITTNGNSASASVYLICDKADLASLQSVQDGLYDLGLEPLPPPTGSDEALISQYHKEMLLDCDAVLIHYGSANEMWLRMKLRELQKLAGYGRAKPMLAKAVYVASPQTDQKLRFKTHEAMTITNFGDFTPTALAPFVNQILQAKGANA